MSDENLKTERQLLSLLLKHKELVEDFMESPLNMECFDSKHRMIVRAIENAHQNNVLLTRQSFVEYISKLVGKKREVSELEIEFALAACTPANPNDIHTIKESILGAFLLRSTSAMVKGFSADREKEGNIIAVKRLSSSLSDLVQGVNDKRKKIIYQDITGFGPEHYQKIVDVRSGKEKDKEFISYGIEELDKTSGIGLAPGTLTLFCGDVGGFKSTMMLLLHILL